MEKMEIKALFGKEWDEELRELVALFLSEWMTRLSRKREKENPEKYQEADKYLMDWEEMVKNQYPDLAEKNQQFLDWIVGYYGEELEAYYLSGLQDGIRVLKWIMRN